MAEQTLKERTARGLLWGILNNGTMQLLNLVFGIVLANLLSPGDYGLAGEVGIFSLLAGALQQSGFIPALVNRRNAVYADFNSVFWFNIVCSACIYIVLWCCAPFISAYFGEPELLWLSRYAFIGFFFASFSIVPRAMLMRELRVKEQTIINLSALLLSGLVGVTMALSGFTYWSVVTQNVVFVSTVSVMSWHYSGFRPSLHVTLQPVREMFRFSGKILVTDIFNCFYNSIFAFVFGRWYTKQEVGVYTQANKWNKMGSDLITGVVQGVAQPMFVQVDNDRERLCRAFHKMLRFTSLMTFPAMLGLAVVAPELITLLIGEKWRSSAQFMQMLCVAGALMPITALYTNFLLSRRRSGIYMWSILSQGILVLALLCTIHHFDWQWHIHILSADIRLGSMQLMVLAYVTVYMLWLLLWHYFVWREIRLTLLSALLDMLPFALAAAASLAAAYWLTHGITTTWLLLLLRVVITAALYFVCLWVTGAHILRESIAYLRHPHSSHS